MRSSGGVEVGNLASTSPIERFLRHLRETAVAVAVLGLIAASCGGEESRFPEAQTGRVVEFFDPATADIGFDPDRQYVSAVAVGRDGTLYIGIGERRSKDGSQNVDGGRLLAVPKSGKPKEIGDSTVTGLAVTADGTLYVASTGSRRSSLSFFRDGEKKHIVDYSDRFGAPTPNSPGVSRFLQGLAIDEKSGDIYVADAHKIDRIDRTGRLLTVSGSRRNEGEPKPAVAEGAGLAGQQFDSIGAIAFAPDSESLYVADGHLRSIIPSNPGSGLQTAPLELPDGTFESGLGRRGVAYDRKTKTVFAVAQADDAIVMLGSHKEPKVKVEKSVLEDVVRMTLGAEGNVYLSGARRVYVFGPPAP